MQDRIPTHEGRVKLTPVSGDLYDMEMADEPTVEGTPLNKATLLTDATAQKFVDLIAQTLPMLPDEAISELVDAIKSNIDGISFLNTNCIKKTHLTWVGTGAGQNTIQVPFKGWLMFIWSLSAYRIGVSMLGRATNSSFQSSIVNESRKGYLFTPQVDWGESEYIQYLDNNNCAKIIASTDTYITIEGGGSTPYSAQYAMNESGVTYHAILLG